MVCSEPCSRHTRALGRRCLGRLRLLRSETRAATREKLLDKADFDQVVHDQARQEQRPELDLRALRVSARQLRGRERQ
eukprot:1114452-Rhodomonas_salina.1